jgi:cytochrome b561
VILILAALYHHFIMKDGILLRMLPGGKTGLQNDTL